MLRYFFFFRGILFNFLRSFFMCVHEIPHSEGASIAFSSGALVPKGSV